MAELPDKSARWVLVGETSSGSHALSLRALARKRQITAGLKGLPLQGLSLPPSGFEFSVHTGGEILAGDAWWLLHAHNHRRDGCVRRDRLAHHRSGGRQTL
jgi:hypothetical protein